MNGLKLVRLSDVMARTSGRADLRIGLIDGPVRLEHEDLAGARIREIARSVGASCTSADSFACLHGTFVAGILAARRGSPAPAICPACTLVVRPIFGAVRQEGNDAPIATPHDLASAILECLDEDVRLINLSLAIRSRSEAGVRQLDHALTRAAQRAVLVVAAAGNEGVLDSSAITRHPWVIPVVACDGRGQPTAASNLGGSIGRRGVTAPGDRVTSLGPAGGQLTLGGTSVAAPFVTGAAALLWSEFPGARAADVKSAITAPRNGRRTSVVPPLLDAVAAYERLSTLSAKEN
jgi:subtilisin family serine protease